MRIVADLETDGLLDELTKIHSLVLLDADTAEILLSCTDDPRGKEMGYSPVSTGLSLLSEADRIYLHNGIKFDIPAILKVHPSWTYRGEIMDTLVAAAMRWAHIKERDFALARKHNFPTHLAGSHSLEAWGIRLGHLKGDFSKSTDWSEWSPEMQTYCEQDCLVTLALVKHIRTSGVTKEALDIEHELAWYLAQQERNGWPFDVEKAVTLNAKLSARREELGEVLKEHFGSWLAPNGITTPKRSMNRKDGTITKGAAYTKLKEVEFNPKSQDHIARCLIKMYGWEPKSFTPTGKPQVDERALAGLERIPIVRPLMEFLLVKKRLEQISEGKEAWFQHMTEDGPEGGKLTGLHHIHGRVIQSGTVTHRAAHSKPNTGQVPKVGVPYGEECRALFTVPDGWVQIGADASGLELRCLAHYMAKWDGGEYAKVVLEGDIHAVNRDALGLEGSHGRHVAKNGFIYPFLYGAGDELIGNNLRIAGAVIPVKRKKSWDDKAFDMAIGNSYRKKFLNNLPALKYVVEAVKETSRKKGYLLLPDGRFAFVRHQHAALNTLLQGAGAIICKRWITEYNQRLLRVVGPQGWAHNWAALGWIHDESQLGVRDQKPLIEQVSSTLVESIRHVGDVFSWRCPLDGEAKVGSNWAETH